jgi:hypothetical protein
VYSACKELLVSLRSAAPRECFANLEIDVPPIASHRDYIRDVKSMHVPDMNPFIDIVAHPDVMTLIPVSKCGCNDRTAPVMVNIHFDVCKFKGKRLEGPFVCHRQFAATIIFII